MKFIVRNYGVFWENAWLQTTHIFCIAKVRSLRMHCCCPQPFVPETLKEELKTTPQIDHINLQLINLCVFRFFFYLDFKDTRTVLKGSLFFNFTKINSLNFFGFLHWKQINTYYQILHKSSQFVNHNFLRSRKCVWLCWITFLEY